MRAVHNHQDDLTNARRIDGTVALVTGATRGIGRALTDAPLARGASTVYATARAPGALRGPPDERRVALRLDVRSRHAFVGVSGLLFGASAATTVVWCASMTAMGGMPMPGGWMLSMAWMRMPGQTWPGAAATFLGMWTVMMVAMMLPAAVPMLWRYRQAVARPGGTRLGLLTALAGAGYLFVWAVLGLAIFPLGAALAAVAMDRPALARVAPLAAGVVVLIAGVCQRTAWKAHHLAGCRRAPGRGGSLLADAGTAWRHGVRLGLHCVRCCANWTAVLLVLGVMDLRAMAVVGTAITIERLASAGDRVARVTGAVAVGAGVLLIARAAGFG